MGKQIPYKKLTRKADNRSKSICDGCKKDLRVRNLVLFKGEFLCRNCRNQTESFRAQASASLIGRGRIKIEDALNRIYEPKLYGVKSSCILNLPLCFVGKKIKIQLIIREDEPCECMRDVKDIAKMYEAIAEDSS